MRFAFHTGFSGGIGHLAALQVAAAPEVWLPEYMFIDKPLQQIFVGRHPRPVNGMIAVPDGPASGSSSTMTQSTGTPSDESHCPGQGDVRS
jgi:L-alanine-DL-glutamate epimerase-like enolase superfamily enzyme